MSSCNGTFGTRGQWLWPGDDPGLSTVSPPHTPGPAGLLSACPAGGSPTPILMWPLPRAGPVGWEANCMGGDQHPLDRLQRPVFYSHPACSPGLSHSGVACLRLPVGATEGQTCPLGPSQAVTKLSTPSPPPSKALQPSLGDPTSLGRAGGRVGARPALSVPAPASMLGCSLSPPSPGPEETQTDGLGSASQPGAQEVEGLLPCEGQPPGNPVHRPELTTWGLQSE